MCQIDIRNLKLSLIIGTKEEERKQKQTISVDLSFEYNAAKAQKSDQLADAVDYEALAKEILLKSEKTQFSLLEHLADFILNLAMKDTRIDAATVKVYKPKAIAEADSVSVELTRTRQ